MQSLRVKVICGLRTKLDQLKAGPIKCGHRAASKIKYHGHVINAASCCERACRKPMFHKLFVPDPKVFLHTDHRRSFEQFVTIDFTDLSIRDRSTLSIDRMHTEGIVELDLRIFREIKISYDCVDVVCATPLYKIFKHGLDSIKLKLSRSAEPQKVVVIPLTLQIVILLFNVKFELVQDLLLVKSQISIIAFSLSLLFNCQGITENRLPHYIVKR